MNKNNFTILIDVSRESLRLCTPVQNEPLILKFDSSLIADLEVVNPVELANRIKLFVETNKIRPGNVVFILSETVYFEKNYPGTTTPGSKDLEAFSDTVPFTTLSSKVFHLGNEYKQIVINRDFYETLRHSFESLGFVVTAVVPWFALGTNGPGELTADTCRVIYHRMDQIIAESMIGSPDDSTFHQKEQAYLEKHKILIVLLSLLFVVMAVVVAIITTSRPAVQKKLPVSIPKTTRVPISPSPTLEPTPTPVATPSAALLKSFNIRILNASGVSGQAATLSSLLRKSGFSKIQTGNSARKITNTVIIATPPAASSAGQYVTGLVSTLYPSPVLETDPQSEYDFVIIIAP